MEIEKYKTWEPIDNMPGEAYFLSLSDEFTTLKILLGELKPIDQRDRQLEIVFDNALMYRVTPEGSRLIPDDRISSNFNYSYDSELLTWFHNESAGIHEDSVLLYYVIYNVDNIIEIITASKGRARWLSGSQ